MTQDAKFRVHLKTFLLSHQIGEDPQKNLAKIRIIANTNPAQWDGKIPSGGIRPDNGFCKVSEATKQRPIVPWWWYPQEKEPVPAVVQDLYRGLSFDFVLTYPGNDQWVYLCVDPSAGVLELLRRQDHLKAFILISLINKKLPAAQRQHKRLHLGTVMKSKDMNRVFTFVAFREDDPRYAAIPGNIPTLSRRVHSASNTANWTVRLPQDRHLYGSFQEFLGG
jgi:hypothetical protein